MLAEWFRYLTTPCPRHLRALGYPQQIIATHARYRRCEDAWRPHLESTKSFILESAAGASGNRRAVILGSGSLLDIPLAELSRDFEQIELVDILHLPWVKRRGLRYPNVRFHDLDVTGLCESLVSLEKLGRGAQGRQTELPQTEPQSLEQSLSCGPIDFLVSVNLLSQLPLMPSAFLEKRCPAYTDADRKAFSQGLIVNHLHWLKAHTDQVCLITDLERSICDGAGHEIDREDALFGVALPAPDREWMWDIALQPEVHPLHDLRHRVGGYCNLREFDFAS
ncbi:hypothetical protein [Pelagibius sp. Alg239-R121]|uniref:hypothetical protein n=1 Tax=Pelagibius sp. Alg239-R121 TaxID=2993448 RepID=UPI0024A79E3A|nr:hypothetical protein [Pelagibius sp. Alg239-R121]